MKKFFARLFKNTKPAPPIDSTTAPLSSQQIMSITNEAGLRSEPIQLSVGVGQSVGKQRDLNEDSLLAITTTAAGNSGSMPFGLYVVADGMGGHQYGEVASNSAARIVSGYVMRKFHTMLFGLPAQLIDESLQEIMSDAISEAQRAVQRDAPGSGTTLTAALVLGQQVTIGHVGDSRAYIVHPEGRLEVVTRDHSLVRRLEELGQLTPEQAAVHPQRNVLYRALGQGDVLEPDVFTMPFPKNGHLLLCSDGLWGVISENSIYQAIAEAPTLQRACQIMVESANNAGGPDNITAILIRYHS